MQSEVGDDLLQGLLVGLRNSVVRMVQRTNWSRVADEALQMLCQSLGLRSTERMLQHEVIIHFFCNFVVDYS